MVPDEEVAQGWANLLQSQLPALASQVSAIEPQLVRAWVDQSLHVGLQPQAAVEAEVETPQSPDFVRRDPLGDPKGVASIGDDDGKAYHGG